MTWELDYSVFGFMDGYTILLILHPLIYENNSIDMLYHRPVIT